MITYEKSSRVPVVAAAVAVVVVAAGAWFWQAQSAGDAIASVDQGASDAVTAWIKPEASTDDLHKALTPEVASDGRPSDVDASDWGTLNGALSKAGIDTNEARRIVNFLRFQRSFETWQNMDETKDGVRRRQLADALIAEVPERLKSGDFTPIEANLMGAVLVAGMDGTEESRAKKLEAWQAQLNQIVPMPEDEKTFNAMTRKTEFSRRLASAYDDWQKTDASDAARAPAKLEQAMADIRRQANSGEL